MPDTDFSQMTLLHAFRFVDSCGDQDTPGLAIPIPDHTLDRLDGCGHVLLAPVFLFFLPIS